MSALRCPCGHTFPDTLGAYGCPNCCGESGRARQADAPHVYGCHNRKPLVTVCAPLCQYTHTALGQADAACAGCRERAA